ncbi:MAG: hypothetical protein L0287_18870 [Anaerolineae bacterium]|nr:hypothetical protein [Anaerolineae bacterium]MCI0608261.1 hypothetical protein [Anaerolineae bacterium]
MDRNRLIAGIAIAVALIILLVYGLTQWRKGQPQASQRSPLSDLTYCSSDDVRPCIVSFSLDSDGNMLVNILTPGTSFPAFYLKIIHEKGESIYECKKVEKFPANVYCIGEAMQVGKVLQFLLISKSENELLAEGSFAIIGLALPTPEDQLTLTLTVSPTQEEPVGTVTVTPTPPGPKSTPSPSYPNPPYPNPSPSYP